MKNKTIAMLAYITLIGWLIAWFRYKNSNDKNELAAFHLGQGLGLVIVSFVLGIIVSIVAAVLPFIADILWVVGIVPLVLAVLGVITAANEVNKPLPLIGIFFTQKFSFLNK